MTEHHGLDLDAIEAASGGHSIFAPSGSAMWLFCSGSLIPNLLAPDNAGYDAAEGTVGHEVGEEWLYGLKEYFEATNYKPTDFDEDDLSDIIDLCAPILLVGTIRHVVERVDDDGKEILAFDVPITSEMLAYVRTYVVWCLTLPGEHYIEQRVYFSQITPIPKQGGTADHAACEPGVLTITDLKYGKGVRVDAADDMTNFHTLVQGKETPFNGNTQALLYALGFFYEHDHKYNFQRIVIRIAQPRLDHFQTWETTREELLAFARYAKVKAHDAWQIGAPRSPSTKGCRFCKVRFNCAALAAWSDDAIEGVFDPVTDVIEGQFRVVDDERALAVKEKIDSRQPPKSLPNPQELTTSQMAWFYRMRKTMEAWFAGLEDELTFRAQNGETIPYYKLVDGRLGNREWREEDKIEEALEFIGLEGDEAFVKKAVSPTQAVERLRAKYPGLSKKKAEELLADLVYRSDGKPTLALLSDPREAQDDVGAVFDKVSSDDL